MLPALISTLRLSRRHGWIVAFGVCFLFALAIPNLMADVPAIDSIKSGSFGEYLAPHEDDLAPFFTKNSALLIKNAFPVLTGLGAKMVLGILAAGWFIDVLLARGFSGLFSPAYTKFTQALFYASGRLVLSLVLTILLGLLFALCLNLLGTGVATLLIVVFFCLPALFAQVVWVSYLYRTRMGISSGFYMALLTIHAVLIVILVPIFFSGEIKATAVSYIDQNLSPRLQEEAQAARHESSQILADRDQVKSAVDSLRSQITQAQTDEKDLAQAIEDRKNSADYVFSRIIKLRAQGDLANARTQLTAFVARYSNDPRTLPAKGQESEIDKALNEQSAAQKAQQIETDRAISKARVALLARAAAGQVTLSEMRTALMGKSFAEVNALFGAPTETDSNKWGYAQRMILDPATNAQYGLTVNFADGVVQGVDYYYGVAR